jgi:predicted nucleic acid-binding protein
VHGATIDAEAIGRFVDRREQREAAERAQELALHTFNDPKVANSAIPLAQAALL